MQNEQEGATTVRDPELAASQAACQAAELACYQAKAAFDACAAPMRQVGGAAGDAYRQVERAYHDAADVFVGCQTILNALHSRPTCWAHIVEQTLETRVRAASVEDADEHAANLVDAAQSVAGRPWIDLDGILVYCQYLRDRSRMDSDVLARAVEAGLLDRRDDGLGVGFGILYRRHRPSKATWWARILSES